MRSSTGAHFIALDHVRAFAAFMVVTWHFTHAAIGYPVPFSYTPAFFPAALLDEGHTGVALFMTLSGYLFARLLNGKSIHYGAFLWNRALRLLPLLILVVTLVGIRKVLSGESTAGYIQSVLAGVVLPTLPNGGWSITAEFHFYLILPLLLWMLARSPFLPLAILVAAIGLRVWLHAARGEVQTLAYLTIVGRIDQFVLGMLAYRFRALVTRRHIAVLTMLAAFAWFYWFFDRQGGYWAAPSYPSPSRLWIVLPTLEGLAYAAFIAWYDSSFHHTHGGVSRLVGRIGEFSYSIYLLHFFAVFGVARFVHEHVMNLSNFYVACAWSVLFFALMAIPGALSYRFVEAPFLTRRTRYIVSPES